MPSQNSNTPKNRASTKSQSTQGRPLATQQNIWLAGLGALASVQAEGSKAFESLVKQGLQIQEKTQALAKEGITQAAQQLETFTHTASAASTPWNRLGGIFEERVAHALKGLGMPTVHEWASLNERIEALEQALANPQKSVTQKFSNAKAPASRSRKTKI